MKKFNSIKEYRDDLIKDDKWAYKTEWDFSWSRARTEIIGIMDIQPGMKILDVGCSNGRTLEYIKNNYNDVELYGIEPDAKMAKIAGKFATVYNTGVEGYLAAFKNKFDAVIMADVIEHLREPWIVVRDIAKRLKDGGAIYSSIPNVMHATVVLNMFANGTFSYSSNDIVNKEHLRFFTINDCAKIFKMAGLNKCLVSGIKAEFPEESIELAKKLGNIFNRDDYYFDIYQFIIKAYKE